ncbi:MAG TPA: enoyl-CoA hydratase [Rhizobiaceae bacterium]|nr:enoyl-CoA hydratase [Rhizobiaceae bacterium]
MAYETILTETRGKVGLITLNRPKALNALNTTVLAEVVDALQEYENDPRIGSIVITGSEKAFAAGADIKQMQAKTYVEAFLEDFFAGWDAMQRIRKPIIAAVAGYALGGGCELAMMCDFILAADTAKFGQPEITLGVMPGMGGSQRLTRFVGKSKAMDMCLTGRIMDAAEAERCGLVSRVVPAGELIEEAMKAAAKIADFSLPAVMMTKEAVNRSYETTLAEGLRFERRLFHSMFALEDQKEGMAAFVEKRTANFHNR